MLPKNKRISRPLFKDLLLSRNYSNSPHFTLRFAVSPSNGPKAAVSVSKKVSKSAVVRNSVRRRTYTVLGSLFNSLQGTHMLFIAKPGAENLSPESLRGEIDSLLIKSGIIVK